MSLTECRQRYQVKRAKQREELHNQGLCAECGLNSTTNWRCTVCRLERKEQRSKYIEKAKATDRRHRWKVKRQIMSIYGGQCISCGETRLPCLELDHINGDGSEHRESLGLSRTCMGLVFYRKLIKENIFPDSLQILCANCHVLKHSKEWDQV